MIDCFRACQVPLDNAVDMAECLVAADYRGHYSHGMNRLDMYLNELRKGTVDGAAKPRILSETVAIAWADGCNGLGATVGNWCMDLAIAKARTVGIGLVSVKNANHYGMAGWYTIRAQQQGLIGLSMSNTSPVMAPTRSKEPALGTNPIAFAAPSTSEGDAFLLDMATTSVALGKIEMKRRKGERCPLGWAQDSNGIPTQCPQVAWEANCLMPLGGAECTSGYKGYGLSAMAEVMSGVLAGANFATKIRKWTLDGGDEPAGLGQVFIAIDPKFFAPGFEDRLSEQNEILRNLLPVIINGRNGSTK